MGLELVAPDPGQWATLTTPNLPTPTFPGPSYNDMKSSTVQELVSFLDTASDSYMSQKAY
jgi:hypothetical protein